MTIKTVIPTAAGTCLFNCGEATSSYPINSSIFVSIHGLKPVQNGIAMDMFGVILDNFAAIWDFFRNKKMENEPNFKPIKIMLTSFYIKIKVSYLKSAAAKNKPK